MSEQDDSVEALAGQVKDLTVTPGAPLMSQGSISRKVLTQFLQNGIQRMRSAETREMLKTDEQPGKTLIQTQRAEWGPLGVDADFGCSQLDIIDKTHPGDTELFTLRHEFVLNSQRTFLQAFEDRRPKTLETKKPIPRQVLINFFDCCNTKMDFPEVREVMIKHAQATKELPNKVIIKIQRQLLEVFGFEQNHGCAMLSKIAQDFPDDMELHKRFQMWQGKAKQTCMQVMQSAGIQVVMPPTNPFGNDPEMKELHEKAMQEVSTMSPEARGELVQKTQKRFEVFSKLPPDARMNHVKKMMGADKLEFVKAQILMMSMMQQHQMQQQGGAPMMQGMPGMNPIAEATTESSPAQQEMM